jgi:hypothetical protein
MSDIARDSAYGGVRATSIFADKTFYLMKSEGVWTSGRSSISMHGAALSQSFTRSRRACRTRRRLAA